MDKPLWGLRVQAPSALGFYRSCAAHRTMGSAHRAGWFRGEFYMPLRRQENRTTALAGEEMHSPFGGWRHHLPPTSWWDYGYLAMGSHASAGKHRVFYSVPWMGWQGNTIRKEAKRPENRVTRFPVEKSGAARIGGGERSEPISRMVILPYDKESQSRNADFMSIAREGDTATLGAKGPVKLKNPPAVRPVNPKNLSL